MFPKFLMLATATGYKQTVWINESHFIQKCFHNYRDQSVLDIYARALGFSYEFAFPSDIHSWGLLNGSFTGVLGLLQRKEVDMVVGDLSVTEETVKEFRAGYPQFIPEITFSTKKDEHVPNLAVFLHPFSIQVWLSIIACVFIVPLLFRKLLRRKHSAIYLFTSTLGSLVGQGIAITPRRRRDYFVLASWIISGAFLYHFYGAVLLSHLTFPSLHGVRTIEELANQVKDGKYECSTYPGSVNAMLLGKSPSPAARVIASKLDGVGYHNCFDFLETYAGDKKPAFVGTRSNLNSYKDFYFISEENFFFAPSAYAMRKDFCCSAELDKVTHRIWASGIFEKIQGKVNYYYFSEYLKTEYWKIPLAEGKLTMPILKEPFIFLTVSHSLAFLVFLIEVCIGKFKKT